MALTYGTTPDVKSARVKQANFLIQQSIDLDDSYPSGGYALTDLAASLGDNVYTILHVDVQPVAGYLFSYDRANDKLIVLDAATGAEIAGATDLQAVTGLVATIWAE